MNNNEININELLENWYKTKLEINLLEKKCEKYKKCCEKMMNNANKNTLSSSEYILKKISMKRNTISKNDVPLEFWNKYSKESSFYSYYLNPISKNKKSKSPRKKKI